MLNEPEPINHPTPTEPAPILLPQHDGDAVSGRDEVLAADDTAGTDDAAAPVTDDAAVRNMFDGVERVHIVGIGGTGMSAIARVLHERGVTVTGSDQQESHYMRQLEDLGVSVTIGHDAANVGDAGLVLVSSAVDAANVETEAAQQAHIPVVKRSQLMHDLLAQQTVIAVAGTHGKTTTTSMLIHILTHAGADPGYIVGGMLASTRTNAHHGSDRLFVIEADEYDNMFLGLSPQVAVLNNIEYDHPDFFTSHEMLVDAFEQYLRRLPEDGTIIANADDLEVMRMVSMRPQHVISFAFNNADATWQASNIHADASGIHFDVLHESEMAGVVALQVPGLHNVYNALAALAASSVQGVPFSDAASALASFVATGRRFEVRAKVARPTGEIVIIDDYAHHPTAIRTTLAAAQQSYPSHHVWAVWQPHTFTRVRALWDDFMHAFASANAVVVVPVFAAREPHDDTMTSQNIAASIAHENTFAVPNFDEAAALIDRYAQPPAVVMILSAGDAPEIGNRLQQHWQTGDMPDDDTAGTNPS